MKKNISFAFLGQIGLVLVLISALFLACAEQMSVEEARQVAVSMGGKSFTAPPRRIDDILSVLEQSTPDNLAGSKKLKEEIDQPPPQTEDPTTLAAYYKRRGDALSRLGRHSQALTDLRLAMTYASQSVASDYRFLRSLAYSEFACGNFKHAIEYMEHSFRLKKNPSAYTGLVKLYTRIGDLEYAEKLANRGVSLCNRLKNQKRWGTWPVIHAAYMKAMVLEAQGKFAEAEYFYGQMLQNWSRSMQQEYPYNYIIHRVYLTRNLRNQDRLVEAEVEARDTLKAMEAIDRASEIFGHEVGELGIILLRQGRL